jgi:uncharacterized protein
MAPIELVPCSEHRLCLSRAISQEMLKHIQENYRLDWHGIHGISHAARVQANGRKLAEETGAILDVVDLFALLHDSQRMNDGTDPDHGLRAANFAQSLQGRWFVLGQDDLETLMFACQFHTAGETEANITVQTCWDADRLDLGRVGRTPMPERLCTSSAKNPRMMEWAYQNSLKGRLRV